MQIVVSSGAASRPRSIPAKPDDEPAKPESDKSVVDEVLYTRLIEMQELPDLSDCPPFLFAVMRGGAQNAPSQLHKELSNLSVIISFTLVITND